MMKAEEYFREVHEAESRMALGLAPAKPKPAYSKERLACGCVLYRIGKPARRPKENR